MKLHTIFANAANYCLTDNNTNGGPGREYSCNAIKFAIRSTHKSTIEKNWLIHVAIEFAKEVADKNNAGACWFDGSYNDTERIQAERYMWLSFLSAYAKDEGV